MQKASDCDTHNSVDDDEQLNLSLAFEYAKDFLEQTDKQIDDLNTRLTTFLGFGGLLLRFSFELPDACRSCALLKVTVIALTASSICINSYGLLANPVGTAVKPSALMSDEWFQERNQTVRAKITNTWIEGIRQIEEAGKAKQILLNRSICLLGLAAVVFAVNGMIATFFLECVSKQ
ncbi:MAG: hypothetical protein AAF827_01015 [Cyanobacteria bacterium P01_D01_bin.6]